MRARVMLRLALLAAVLVSPAQAVAQGAFLPVRARDIVIAYNRGLRASIAPGLFLPVHGGELGFSVAAEVRYGIWLGPVILAPGIRAAGYFPSDRRAAAGFATLRSTFPVGPVGPYIFGGVGPGYVSHPSEFGLAYLAGAGFMVHIGRRFGIGAEGSYQAVTRTHFGAIFVGPNVLFAF